MALFRYQIIDNTGKRRSGTIDAHDEREAKEKLRDQDAMVIAISADGKVDSKNALKGDNLVTFTMQLSQLVNAGVPLYESLITIEEQYRNEPYHPVILSLCEQIRSGTSLSKSMSQHPTSFDKLYRGMVAAGEQAGALDIVLERLTNFLNKRNKLKKQISTAMIYPGILSIFAFVVILLLLGFVVPSIEGIFEGRQLNSFTNLVLGISHFFRYWWWLYLPIFSFVITVIIMRLRTQAGKIWLEKQLLKIPGIRTLLIQAALARFCRTMGTLQQGGLTMIDSLRIAREVMNNVTLEQEMKEAETKIIEGSSFSAEIAKSKWIPPMVSRMLMVGEDSGTTQIMFNKIADLYEDELEKTLDRLLALAQPVILITMGIVIGTVLMAILLPLTDVSSFATS